MREGRELGLGIFRLASGLCNRCHVPCTASGGTSLSIRPKYPSGFTSTRPPEVNDDSARSSPQTRCANVTTPSQTEQNTPSRSGKFQCSRAHAEDRVFDRPL